MFGQLVNFEKGAVMGALLKISSNSSLSSPPPQSHSRDAPKNDSRKNPSPLGLNPDSGGADRVACDIMNVEERRFHVFARRNSIRKNTKSQ
jgi:hypothetical protein